MRLRSLALAAALLPMAACGSDGTDKKTACDNIEKAITSIGSSAQLQAPPNANEGFQAVYAEAAKKIRAAADDSKDKNVKNAGLSVATALDMLTAAFADGKPTGGPETLTASDNLTKAAADLEKNCGPIGT